MNAFVPGSEDVLSKEKDKQLLKGEDDASESDEDDEDDDDEDDDEDDDDYADEADRKKAAKDKEYQG